MAARGGGVNEWADTEWGGTAVAETTTSGNVVRMMPAKAATGWEPIYTPDRLMPTSTHSPLRRMREEQALYWNHPWIRVAESTVTRRVAGLPWHLEDGDSDEEVDDTGNNATLKSVQTLLEKPQSALEPRDRQPGIATWTNLLKITSRHLGLCGMTHWYPDQPDANGLPAALMYVNPARLMPVTATNGALLAWSLDPKDEARPETGTIFAVEDILTFYLDPPDSGGLSSGLVQAAWLKAQITLRGDTHYLSSLYGGGALSGIVTPKEGAMQDEQYATVQRELRNIQEAPDSARRLAVLRGPVDYHRTSATAQELDLSEYAAMTRSDILTVWQVPDSQAGVPAEAGLNSGGTKEQDYQVLMQGPVHDRVTILYETIQYGLLDRWQAAGASPQIVFEEPVFEDRTPSFVLAEKAQNIPLTRNQRLAIIGEDPLPEYGPDGEPLGLAIDLPMNLVTVGQGEEPEKLNEGRFTKSKVKVLEPVEPKVLPPIMPPALPANVPSPAKAGGLPRASVLRRFEPLVEKAIRSFLTEQKHDIANRIRARGEHLARKPTDRSVWWSDKWDDKLLDALKVGVAGVSATVAAKVQSQLGAPAKAFSDTIASLILRSVGRRITGINATTRDEIGRLIGEAFAQGLAPSQVAELIEEATPFNEARAELIARTETALAYNEAAVTSYKEYGVERVEVIDGDEDDECATAHGQIWTLDEALAEPVAHPNCVRDFSPVFA
jgi:hypothetical protein